MDVNIALLPDEEAAGPILEKSGQITDAFGGEVRLNRTDMLPHLTLYLTGFPADQLPRITDAIKRIAAPLPALQVKLNRFKVKNGNVLWLVEKSSALDKLHRQVVTALNPMRKGLIAEIWDQRKARLNPKERDRLKEVGYPTSLDAWAPHFTVGKVIDTPDEEVAAKLEPVPFRFQARTIGIGEVGPHGTFRKPFELVRFG
jgi:hypothetical protein